MADDIVRMATTIAALDPRQYEQGVQKVEAAANKAVAANTRLEQSTEKMARTTVVSVSAIDRLQAANDKTFAAEQRRQRQIETLDRALQQGTVTQERYARVLQSVEQSYSKHAAAGAPVAANLNNIAVAATNTGRALTLVRQGFAEAQPHMEQYAASGGILSAVLGRLGVAGTLAAAAFGAFSLAIAKGVEEFTEDETAITRLEQSIRVTGGAAGFSAAQVETFVDQMIRLVGVSDNDVRRAATSLTGFAAAGRLGFEEVIRTAADLTALFGGDLQSNTERLGKELQDLATGATQQLGRSFHALGADARMAIEELARSGRGTEAATRALEAMRQTIGGAGESQANTISGAMRQSAEATGDLLSTIARVTGATERARSATMGWRDAMLAVRDAITWTPESRAQAVQSQIELTARQIGELELTVNRAESRMANMSAQQRAETIALPGNAGYRDALRRLNDYRARQAGQIDQLAGGGITRDGYAGEEQAAMARRAGEMAAEREAAAVAEQRNRRTREYITSLEREQELARLAPNIRAQQVAADNAEVQVLQRLTGSQESNLQLLRRLPQAQEESNRRQVESARAIAISTQAMQQNSQAGAQVAQQREQARTTLEEQIHGLQREADALGQSERERYVTSQGLQAERTGRQLNSEELQRYVERVRTEAGALYDTQQARRQATQALEEQARAINRTVDRVVDFAADGFDRILQNGVGTWKDLWDEFVTIGRKAIAQAIAEALLRPIVVPIVTELVGSFGGMFGVGASGVTVVQGASGPYLSAGGQPIGLNGGGGLSVPNMPSTSLLERIFDGSAFGGNSGTLTPGLDAWAFRNLGFGQIDNFAGQSAGAMGPFQGGSGLFGGGGVGGALSGFSSLGNLLGIAGAGLPGLMSGNFAQAGLGIGGAALGTLIFPGIGTAIGGFLGNMLGGLFGKKKPTGPGGAAFVWADHMDEPWVMGSPVMGDKNVIRGLGSAYQAGLAQILKASGGSAITGGSQVNLGYWGDKYRTAGVGYGNNQFDHFDKPEDAVQRALNLTGGGLQIAGIGRAAQSVLTNEGGSAPLDQLVQDLAKAVTFQQAYDAAISDTNETTSQVEQQLKALNAQFDQMKTAAAGYGYGAEELEAARKRALAKMTEAFNDNVQQTLLAMTDPQAAALAALDKARAVAVKDAAALGADINAVETLYGKQRAEIVKAYAAQAAAEAQKLADFNFSVKNAILGATDPQAAALAALEQQRQAAIKQATDLGADVNAVEELYGLQRVAIIKKYADEAAAASAVAAQQLSDFNFSVANSLLGMTDQQAAELAAFDRAHEATLKTATTIGADVNAVEELYGKQRAAIVKRYADEAAAAEAAAMERLKAQALSLKQWLDAQVFSNTSSSSPSTRLSEAQRMFGEQIGLARGGDANAFQGITGYASQLLAAAKDFFASSGDFVAIEAMTRSQISELGKALGLPGFASGGAFTVGGFGGTDSQIVPIRATPGERVTVETPAQQRAGSATTEGVQELRAEVANLNGTIDALRREIRMSGHLRAIGR
jgi:hypothetical protein